MKKTVNYKGQNIKVDFEKLNFTRIVTKIEGVKILDSVGLNDFSINGKIYNVLWTMKTNKKPSVQLHFEGFTCGHSEKKMIEFIISKYGV